uniref:DNA polymerase family B n=1 Tax=Spizellomyces sp. 'palustris' TaxID=117820 RepID=UPI0010FBECC0|nr:DNA polymerase family B [Spizellomyces sp. 'palustris']QCQ69046.1 DNA polymerase family B [Spizellomyces sp. 'palustris']
MDFMTELFVYDWVHRGNIIFGHCIDEQGNYCMIKINGFSPFCYVEGDTIPPSTVIPVKVSYKKMATSRDIYTLYPFHKVFFDSKKDMTQFVFENKKKCHMSDIPYITMFLSQFNINNVGWIRVPSLNIRDPCDIETVPDKNPYPHPKIMIFDIEVKSSDLRMPKAYKLADRIEMISVIVSRYRTPYQHCKKILLHTHTSQLGVTDTIEIPCTDEIQLITKFFELIKSENPDIITGFNILGFDIKYIISRLQLRLMEIPDVSRGLKGTIDVINVDWSTSAYGFNAYNRLIIGGRLILDMFLYLKRMKLEKYSLDYISSKFLGERKNDMNHVKMMEIFNTRDPAGLLEIAEYCIQDSVLV